MRQRRVQPGTLFTAMDRLRRDQVDANDFANGCAVSRIYFTPQETMTMFRAFAGSNMTISWEQFSSVLIRHTAPLIDDDHVDGILKNGDIGSGSAEDDVEKQERELLMGTSLIAQSEQHTPNTTHRTVSNNKVPADDFCADVGVGSRKDTSTSIAEDDIERQEIEHLLSTTSVNRTQRVYVRPVRDYTNFGSDVNETLNSCATAHEISASASTTPRRFRSTLTADSPPFQRSHGLRSDGATRHQDTLNDLYLRYDIKPIDAGDSVHMSRRYAPLYHAIAPRFKSKPRSALRQMLNRQKGDPLQVGPGRGWLLLLRDCGRHDYDCDVAVK